MRALRLADSPQGPTPEYSTVPQPEPGAGEVLIRVYAAGVTPTELLWYPTSHTRTGERRVGAIPGHEFSGVVAGLGRDVDGLELGQEVFGMNDWFADGATAEYCVAPLTSLASKPLGLAHATAAATPIGALTAWQGLFDRARLQPGETVLVQGGAGAVGAFAVQLANLHGAKVIATAAGRNLDFVASLGAGHVIDYRRSRFEESARDVDVVFDTVGGETLERSWGVLKPDGRMVTIAADAEEAREGRVKDAFFIVEPNRKQLTEVAGLIDAGRIKPVVDTVLPWSQAADAYTGRAERRGIGKLVVVTTQESGTDGQTER